MINEPLVSILIPTYNRSTLLKRAVKSALKQSYENIEIIISDNCCTDNTQEVISIFNESKKIKYFRNEKNIGSILNWRLALERAKGDFSIILCDDDYFLDERYIENAVKLFNKYNSINLVITDCVLGRSNSEHRTHLGLSECVNGLTFFRNFWSKNFSIPVISNVFKTSQALELDPFKDSDILYSDIALWLKLMLLGDVGYISSSSVYYYFHEYNIVTNLSWSQLIKNAKFIRNIKNFMIENKYDIYFIESWANKFVNRYIYFISGVKNLRFVSYDTYKSILNESGCSYSYIEFLHYIFNRVIRSIKSKIGGLIK
jgi:glycosyltransferase involved in cell wall biosynthesis